MTGMKVVAPRPDEKNLHQKTAVNLFLFLLCLYLLTASGLNISWSDVSQARLAVLKSIIYDHNLRVPPALGLQGPDGGWYSLYGIGSVLVSLPFALISALLGIAPEHILSLLNQVVGASTAVMIFFFCGMLGYSRRSSLLVALFYGAGTIAWYYAKDPGDHAIETFFLLSSFFAAVRWRMHGKARWMLLSGGALGWALLMRWTTLLAAPGLGLLLLSSADGRKLREFLRRAALFGTGVLPFVVIALWYNHYRYGSIFETGYGLLASRNEVRHFSGTSFAVGLAGLLMSPGKGYFYFSPIAALSLVSWRGFARRHLLLALGFSLTILLHVLVFAKYVYWSGDWAWGPRYLVVLTPLIMIPVASFLDAPETAGVRGKRLIAFLFLVSALVQLASVTVNHYRYFYYLHYHDGVEFFQASGKGVPTIQEPPDETYFNPRQSQLLLQFVFIKDMARSFLPGDSAGHSWLASVPDLEKKVFLSVPDFWWCYLLAVKDNPIGCILAFLLLIYCAISAVRLRRLLSPTSVGAQGATE